MTRHGAGPLVLKSLLLVAGCGWNAGPATAKPAAGADQPGVDSADFQPMLDDLHFLFVPGTTFKSIKQSGKNTSENEVTATHDTKVTPVVTCVVVHDEVVKKGVLGGGDRRLVRAGQAGRQRGSRHPFP